MFKTVWLIRRNPAMSRDEFIEYYETKHSKFIEFTPGVRKYIRRYPEYLTTPAMERVETALPFDVMMEIWWADRASYEASMSSVETSVLPEIQADEAKLFDRQSDGWCTTLLVEAEYETDLSSPTFESTYVAHGSATP